MGFKTEESQSTSQEVIILAREHCDRSSAEKVSFPERISPQKFIYQHKLKQLCHRSLMMNELTRLRLKYTRSIMKRTL